MNSSLTVTSQLIPVFLGQIGGIPAYVCDARKLHAFLEGGKRFTSWIQERIEKYGFEENKDYIVTVSKSGKSLKNQSYRISPKSGRNSERGRPSTEYHLSLDMAKELSMVENNEQGRAARRYFIEMEKQALASAGQIVPPSHLETLTPSEQQTLSEIIHKRAEGYGEA
jgi:phage anti-repressor protein